MSKQLGIVLTGRGDPGTLASYQGLAETLTRSSPNMTVEIIHTWMAPEDLDTGEDGLPLYDLSTFDLMGAVKDCIDDFPLVDEVTLVAFCGGCEAALRYCRTDQRVARVIAISPSTWYRFATPWNRAAAMRRARENHPYSPLIVCPMPSGGTAKYRLSPKLWAAGDREPLAEFLATYGWGMPNLYFIALGADLARPPASVRRLYEAASVPARAPNKGYVELSGIDHDYRLRPDHISTVNRAVERCLAGGSFDETWS